MWYIRRGWRGFKMKKTKKGVIFLIVLCIGFLLLKLPVSAKADEIEKVKVTVSYGIEGNYKMFFAMPIDVQLENISKEEFKGTIEVLVPNETKTKDLYSQAVSLKGEEKRGFVIPVNGVNVGTKVKVSLKEDERVISEKELKVNVSDVNYNDVLIGALTDDIKPIEYLKEYRDTEDVVGKMNINGVKLVPLSLDYLSSNNKNLQILDVIIINNFDTSKLTDEMLGNLNIWIENGGTLVLGGSEKVLNNINKSFLNVNYGSPETKLTKFNKDEVNIKSGVLGGEYGNIKLKDSSKVLTTEIQKKLGNIILTSFDLGEKNLQEYGEKNSILSQILFKDYRDKHSNGGFNGGYPYELEDLLNNLPMDKEISLVKIGAVLLVFALICSFGAYFLLKIVGKRELIWAIIPIISVVFTFIMFNLGKDTSVNDLVVNGINCIGVNEDGMGTINSYISLANKYKSDLNIEEPPGMRIEYMARDIGYGMNNTGDEKDKITLRTRFERDKTFYEFRDLGALEIKKFKILGKEKKFNKIESSLNFDGEALKGKVKNTLGSDASKFIVVFGNSVWDIGELKADEEYNFENVKPTYSGNCKSYADDIYTKFTQQYYSGSLNEKDAELKGQGRLSSLLRFVSSGATSKDAYVLAITEDEINYGLSFDTDNITRNSQTIYNCKINIGLKDSEGNTVYPAGYLVGNIEKTSDTAGVSLDDNIAWGRGEAIVRYQFPEKFTPKEVAFLEVKNSNSSGFKGNMEIFNYKTEKFEGVNFTDGRWSNKDLKNYVLDGSLRVKYILKDEEGCTLPSLSAKGRIQ